MKRFLRTVGRIVAYPITKPVELVTQGAEKAMAEMIKGIVRHLITTVGGALITAGYASADDIQALAGAAAILAGVIWSMVSKKDA